MVMTVLAFHCVSARVHASRLDLIIRIVMIVIVILPLVAPV